MIKKIMIKFTVFFLPATILIVLVGLLCWVGGSEKWRLVTNVIGAIVYFVTAIAFVATDFEEL